MAKRSTPSIFFGLFTNLATSSKDPNAFSRLGVPISYEITHFAASRVGFHSVSLSVLSLILTETFTDSTLPAEDGSRPCRYHTHIRWPRDQHRISICSASLPNLATYPPMPKHVQPTRCTYLLRIYAFGCSRAVQNFHCGPSSPSCRSGEVHTPSQPSRGSSNEGATNHHSLQCLSNAISSTLQHLLLTLGALRRLETHGSPKETHAEIGDARITERNPCGQQERDALHHTFIFWSEIGPGGGGGRG